MLHRAAPGLLAAALVTLTACMDLSPRAAGVCGNGVLEPAEDCDAPGSAGCNAQCRLECQAPTDCPPAWVCGADQLCERATGRSVQALRAPSL